LQGLGLDRFTKVHRSDFEPKNNIENVKNRQKISFSVVFHRDDPQKQANTEELLF